MLILLTCIYLCRRHAEWLFETVYQCRPETHAAEAPGVCHVQWRAGPVSSVSASHSRCVTGHLCRFLCNYVKSIDWSAVDVFFNLYNTSLPFFSERLTEALRMNPSPNVTTQMFLMFRVLLLRISSQHLTSLWPIMVTELVRPHLLRAWLLTPIL